MGKPNALILAGYDKVDHKIKIKRKKEIIETYDGDEIYIGKNKFLYTLAGKPIIQYVLDAVYGAQINGRKIYDKIFLYNDIEIIKNTIDVDNYPNLVLKQMTESVGGHWNDFYYNHMDYGDRVDVFFGDTPRIQTEDVEWIHELYNSIIGIKKDHRGIISRMLFGIVKFEDMDDNWLKHRIKYIKRGQNKGKLKSFVGFEDYQARVGNSGALIKHKSQDKLIEYKAVNFIYNMRKALTPSSFSKILYSLWKTKNFNVIRQIKQKCINQNNMIDAIIQVVSDVFKIDLSEFAGSYVMITKNASRWENDIDGPKDLKALRRKFANKKK
ncbi:hypothetical protein ACFL20_01205 [Spirochaetota bacterium]